MLLLLLLLLLFLRKIHTSEPFKSKAFRLKPWPNGLACLCKSDASLQNQNLHMYCLQQPIRSRSLLWSLGTACLSSALPAWIQIANDRRIVAQCPRVVLCEDGLPNLRFMATRIKEKCQVRFRYVGNLSEKWNLEEKSRLLKFTVIYSRWNRSRCLQGLDLDFALSHLISRLNRPQTPQKHKKSPPHR